MTAMDSVAFVLGAWVGGTGLVLGAEKARQELLARRASRRRLAALPDPAPETVDAGLNQLRALIPAQRQGGGRRAS